MRRYPGDAFARQPVHTVYGGAHLFKSDSAQKLGEAALRALSRYAPDAATFGDALSLNEEFSHKVYDRVVEKLKREPVEDFRIDFEDGYGNRPDEEEDGHAFAASRRSPKASPKARYLRSSASESRRSQINCPFARPVPWIFF